jgi:hypothetical protein
MNAEQFSKLSKEIRKFQLAGIRLVEAHCKLGQLREELPPNAKLDTAIGYKIRPDKRNVAINAEFVLSSTYEGAEADTSPAIYVSAQFLVHYGLAKPVTKKTLEAVLENLAIPHIWPFWRELVHSLTTRMGLPPFPVPLFNLSQSPKPDRRTENRERGESAP